MSTVAGIQNTANTRPAPKQFVISYSNSTMSEAVTADDCHFEHGFVVFMSYDPEVGYRIVKAVNTEHVAMVEQRK